MVIELLKLSYSDILYNDLVGSMNMTRAYFADWLCLTREKGTTLPPDTEAPEIAMCEIMESGPSYATASFIL